MGETIAALYVAADGAYANLPGVEVWDEARDARTYAGPYPVVAHPPCARWGRYWHGSPRKPHQYAKGDDGGCFTAALASVRAWGGVLEHPAHSHAWFAHGRPWPAASGGWQRDIEGGWCCHVEQGWYGHPARKATWLYAVGGDLPELRWGEGEQRLDWVLVERRGYECARRMGMVSSLGGGGSAGKREATPPAFRDLLIGMARSVQPAQVAA
jgi:hypothetical protein